LARKKIVMSSNEQNRIKAATHVVDAVEQGIRNLKDSGFVEISRVAEVILASEGKVVVSGVGKSGIVAHKIAASLSSNGVAAVFMNAAEALHGDLGMVCPNDNVILLSNSGSTNEIIRIIPSLRKIGATLIAIVNRRGSLLEKEADHVIGASIVSEGDVLDLAPMGSSTMALIVGDALVAMLQKETDFTSERFAVFHPGGTLGRSLLMTAGDVMIPFERVGRVSLDASFKEVVSQLTRFSLGIIIVLNEDEELVGVISDGDVRRTVLFEDYDKKAEEIMSANPVVLKPVEKLGRVLKVMENPDLRISAAPVADASGVLGVVRLHDVLGN